MSKKRVLLEKRISIKNKKPKEIIEIENFYGITLKKISESNILDDEVTIHLGYNFYSVNKLNEVTGISIRFIKNKNEQNNPIKKNKKLKFLALTEINLTDLSTILPLPNLTHLYLGGNNIKDISLIINSPLLEHLAIWNNPINDFSPLKKLINLQNLYCQKTGIKNLDFAKSLEKLQVFDANDNNISELDCFQHNNKLKYINLTKNNIKTVSSEVAQKFDWLNQNNETNHPRMILNENPLSYPPNSVYKLGNKTIKNYYETAEKYGYAPLSEGRIIVIGDGSAGKSSLIERILYDTFEQGKSQTNGIFIENWNIKHQDNRELTFHIWDFGGQEIQHAVHKFFFTEGCLYVLVLDNRKEEEPEYWLQQIESLGGKAPVLVVFNKQDDNVTEIADRKFLKEKYPNIVGFYNTSCKTGIGIDDFKKDLERNVIKLPTVEELFPNNWFEIKKSIENCTSGDQHYLDYNSFKEICNKNNAYREETQKLLLKYFTTIGAVTWFGDTYLNFLHVLSPKWITQGVYKIITSKKTANLSGVINIKNFKELLHPISENDYTYDEEHYGYILSMMKKFDLCYTPDDKVILVPSAFGKVPKVEYSDFRGSEVRTYILQFNDYMPLALIHRFTAKKLPNAYDKNYWYTGIVLTDSMSDTLAMVQADKEAKRIYIRIKGSEKLGMWEHIRREFDEISSSYAKISYNELVSLDDNSENTVTYEDLLSHIRAKKTIYFHPKLGRDFNVGYLIGMFESKEHTIDKLKNPEIELFELKKDPVPPIVLQILNNNSPTVNTQITNEINIDINLINQLSSKIKGEAGYLLEELGQTNKNLSEALNKVIQFANDTKGAKNSGTVIEKGWGRKLKSIVKTLSNAGEQLKNIQDGGEALKAILQGINDLASQFNLEDILTLF